MLQHKQDEVPNVETTELQQLNKHQTAEQTPDIINIFISACRQSSFSGVLLILNSNTTILFSGVFFRCHFSSVTGQCQHLGVSCPDITLFIVFFTRTHWYIPTDTQLNSATTVSRVRHVSMPSSQRLGLGTPRE